MDEARIPRHIAIIMDGNGRWAKKRLMPRSAGHRAGMKRMIGLSEHIFDRGVRCCTLFALSTENLSRSKEELDGLFALLREYFPENAETLRGKNITLRVIGDRSLLPADVVQVIEAGEKRTRVGARGALVLAFGCGGRLDILSAVNKAVRAGKEVTMEEFSSMLSEGDLPDPDLLIRTGRELRISNFLLWQAAYSELYFTDVLFPDFSDKELDKAIEAFSHRERRFGKA